MELMKNNFARIWIFFASVQLAVILLILLTIDLCFAYISIDGRSIIFDPMNLVGILPWLKTRGVQNLPHTLWVYIFILLLCFLVINLLVCTVVRLLQLTRRWRKHGGSKRIYFALSTHVMHGGVVVILTGYLLSYTMSQVEPSVTFVPRKSTVIPNTKLSLELLDMTLPIYQGSRLEGFSGRVILPEMQLRLVSGERKKVATLGFNDPIHFQGYSVFLQRFSPKKKSDMSISRYIVIDIRRDPGVLFYFTGIIFFVLGMFGYVIFRTDTRQSRLSL